MKPQNRFILTLTPALKRVLERASKHRGCSQAEVIKSALYEHLDTFLRADNEESAHSIHGTPSHETNNQRVGEEQKWKPN